MQRIHLEGCVVHLDRRTVVRPHETVHLTTKEAELLVFLAGRVGTDVSRSDLLEQVWGYHAQARTRAVDFTVRRLRGKIDKPYDRSMLHTVRGAGYRLQA